MMLENNFLWTLLVLKVTILECVDSFSPVHGGRETTQNPERDRGSVTTPVRLPLGNQLPSIHPASSELTEYLPVPHGSIPRCAQDLMTICDRVENYPRDLIERIVLNGPEDSSSMDRMKTHGTEASDILLKKKSLNDESDGLQEPPRDMILIKNRLRRSISKFKCGCGFRLSFEYVDIAVNQRGDWRIIAHSNKTNLGLDYFPIHVELCKNPARNMDRNSTELVEQLFTLIPLPCLSKDGKSLEIDYFLFPTCCLCKF